jgi:lipopolysaccharide/colanic/teichoic acid biosynthesis glycosyltransferase
MKPGITGPWQVAGRSELTFEDRLKLDEEYCARRGNRRDLKILFKTFLKVVRSEGAE